MGQRPNSPDDFWIKVKKVPGSCWEWIGGRSVQGYGKWTFADRTVVAHRFSWQIVNGPIPKGAMILHSCDNPPCVNPSHLRLGSHRENMEDRQKRGRTARHGNPRLTWDKAEKIRALDAAGTGRASIAKRFCVTEACVSMIVSGKRWKIRPHALINPERSRRIRSSGRR